MLDSKLDQKFPKSKKNLNDFIIFAQFMSRMCGIVVEHQCSSAPESEDRRGVLTGK